MIVSEIPLGASVLLDANVLVCHFMPHPVFGDASTELVERIGLGEIPGPPRPMHSAKSLIAS